MVSTGKPKLCLVLDKVYHVTETPDQYAMSLPVWDVLRLAVISGTHVSFGLSKIYFEGILFCSDVKRCLLVRLVIRYFELWHPRCVLDHSIKQS
jgi:hypothetical protein